MIFEDEAGNELWRANGDAVPPGTLVTSLDGTRYYAVRTAVATTEADDQLPDRVTLRLAH